MTLRSMTGFGTAFVEHEGVSVSVVARSVNHRFLDIAIKLPLELRSLEHALRGIAKRKLARGRLELVVDLQTGGRSLGAQLNSGAVSDLVRFANQLESDGVASAELRAIDVLRFPGVIDEGDVAASTELDEATLSSARTALDVLVHARAQEGEELSATLNDVTAGLNRCLLSMSALAAARADDLVVRARERLVKIINSSLSTDATDGSVNQVDEARLLQEAGLLAERLDVSEEVERLDVHLRTIAGVLEQGGVCGKRLDFLAQEVLREINTVASKCRDADLAGVAVDAKVLCERFREQVQNVE